MARSIKGFRNSRPQINIGPKGLILCEGETEEKYFKALLAREPHRRAFSTINVEVVKPKNHLPVGLVSEAILRNKLSKKDKNPYKFIYVIFDRDGHADIPKAFEMCREFDPEIKIVFSIPCFEYFVLQHFERTTKPFSNCDDVVSYIKKYIPNYEKASSLFESLLPHMEYGIKNCEWMCTQSVSNLVGSQRVYQLSAYSNIHELICYLYSIIGIKM